MDGLDTTVEKRHRLLDQRSSFVMDGLDTADLRRLLDQRLLCWSRYDGGPAPPSTRPTVAYISEIKAPKRPVRPFSARCENQSCVLQAVQIPET